MRHQSPVPALSALPLLALFAALLLAPAPARAVDMPWTTIYGVARDERSVETIAKDKKIATEIKAELMKRDEKKGFAVKVYCFTGRVFLVGQLNDTAFRDVAAKTAKAASGVRAVTSYFLPESDTLKADLEIAAKVRAGLVADKDLSATQIESEVFNGTVVLLGMVRDSKDVKGAVAVARKISGVKEVKSFLIPGKK